MRPTPEPSGVCVSPANKWRRSLPSEDLRHKLVDLRARLVQGLLAPRRGPVVFTRLPVDHEHFTLQVPGTFQAMQERVQCAQRQVVAMAGQSRINAKPKTGSRAAWCKM